MEAFEHLENGCLPGWPGRTRVMLTSGGTHVFRFEPVEKDKILELGGGRVVTLERESHYNFLTATQELGYEVGDLSKYYPCFVYQIVQESQKRVVFCLREHGKFNFTHKKKTLS